METFYCEECGLEGDTRVVVRDLTLPVMGEEITIRAPRRECVKCGAWVGDSELDSLALQKAYDVYRDRHGLIRPEEIQSMRDRFGLTQRGFAAVLGWGEVSVHRYENGSLPDRGHNRLLCFLRNPERMIEFLEENLEDLSESAQEKVRECIDRERTSVRGAPDYGLARSFRSALRTPG